MTTPLNDHFPDDERDINVEGNVEGQIVNIGGQIIMNQPAANTPQSVDPKAKPRVFISYARADAEKLATELRKRLEAGGIPLWQDRARMEGGRDWWLQIAEALETVEFMVLIMTPTAMKSQVVRKEWRYARQQGVCVYPVKGAPDLDFGSLPRWMRDSHFYDLKHEWTKFVNDLNERCEVRRVPFMVEDLPPDFVARPGEFDAVIKQLLDAKHEEPVAITAALRGAGGYGKTTLARAICHHEEVQQAFDDGVLWVTLGERPENLIGKIEDLIYVISGKRPGANNIETATAELVKVLEDRDLLIVIDDVWRSTDLKPFLQGGKRCARLITTRNSDVLPADAQKINVDAMKQSEAVSLLSSGLPTSESGAMVTLAKRLGEWPLLIKLANGVLRNRVIDKKQPLAEALDWVNMGLDKRGLTVFDPKNPATFDPHDSKQRSQAVSATLEVSLNLLTDEDRARYNELAIFPEDTPIPLATLAAYWGATGELEDFDTEELCERLDRLSLLLSFDPTARLIQMHDVVRAYLRTELSERLPYLHGELLDGHHTARWATMPVDEPYLWDWLTYHLSNASRLDELIATVKDLRYLVAKTYLRGSAQAEADIMRAYSAELLQRMDSINLFLEPGVQLEDTQPSGQKPVSTPVVSLLKHQFSNMTHLLNRCRTAEEIAATLYSRLAHLTDLAEACKTLLAEVKPPYIRLWRGLPDLPHPALIRTLIGHTAMLRACVVSPNGNFIVSASDDRTLKVWDAETGVERLTLTGHTERVHCCAISPDSSFIVSGSWDYNVKIWDAANGKERFTLTGHTDCVYGCAISPRGDFIVSTSKDGTLRLWDATTGDERLVIKEEREGGLDWCAVSPDGAWIVANVPGGRFKFWDAATGEERQIIETGEEEIYSAALSPKGDFVVSAFWNGTVKLWDIASGAERMKLGGHRDTILDCAVSPAGNFLVTASYNRTLTIWDLASQTERATLTGHSDAVHACAISPNGNWIVSASDDRTLKVWDVQFVNSSDSATAALVEMVNTPIRNMRSDNYEVYRSIVRGCAVSPAGDYIVSAAEDATLKTWDAETGLERRTLQGHAKTVSGCAVDSVGEKIVSASWDATVRVWDAETGGKWLIMRDDTDQFGAVNGCAISPTGDFIVSAAQRGKVYIWDAKTGKQKTILSGHLKYVHSCAVNSTGEFIVSASEDTLLNVWQVKNGFKIRTLGGHEAGVRCCAISPNNDYVVSASLDRTLKIWETDNWTERFTLRGHGGGVLGCAISPKGDWILSVAADGSLKAWDAQTGQCMTTLYVDGVLYCCAIHPDGEHIVAGGAGGLYWLQLIR